MRLFYPVFRIRPSHARLLHVSFAQIWPVLAVQPRCRKIFLLCPLSAIPRRTDLLYLPRIRIGARSLHRPYPAHGCRTSRRKRRIPRQSCRWPTPRLLFAAARSGASMPRLYLVFEQRVERVGVGTELTKMSSGSTLSQFVLTTALVA